MQQPLAIDLTFRPKSYFWAYDNHIKLSSDIKGAHRKILYERAIAEGDIEFANAIEALDILASVIRVPPSIDEALGDTHERFFV